MGHVSNTQRSHQDIHRNGSDIHVSEATGSVSANITSSEMSLWRQHTWPKAIHIGAAVEQLSRFPLSYITRHSTTRALCRLSRLTKPLGRPLRVTSRPLSLLYTRPRSVHGGTPPHRAVSPSYCRAELEEAAARRAARPQRHLAAAPVLLRRLVQTGSLS